MTLFSGYNQLGARSVTKVVKSATSGVPKQVNQIPGIYSFPDHTNWTDIYADQYRAAVLKDSENTTTEYLVWAANTGNLSTFEDQLISTGQAIFEPNGLQVGTVYTDGTDTVLIRDNNLQDISSVSYLVVSRGDVTYSDTGWVDETDFSQGRTGSNPYLVFEVSTSGHVVTLTEAQLLQLDGGLSKERGDQIQEVWFSVKECQFFWTKNDQAKRFDWSNRDQKWVPYKGTRPIYLGQISFDLPQVTLSPNPSGLRVGYPIPAILYVGNQPGEASLQVTGIPVIDSSMSNTTASTLNLSTGVLRLSQDFIQQYLGQSLWYLPRDFDASFDGKLGVLTDTELYLIPKPRKCEYPLVSIGSRKYLTAIPVETEADLYSPSSGSFTYAVSSGKIQLSSSDVAKGTSASSTFSVSYYQEPVMYHGVSLSGKPQSVKAPVLLVEDSGNYYVPDAETLPLSLVSSAKRGLGVSGILDIYDATGAKPNGTDPASVRPGEGSPTTGRLRSVDDGLSDSFIYSRKSVVQNTAVVDTAADFPSNPVSGTVYIAKEKTGSFGSQIFIHPNDIPDDGELYFSQSSFTPAAYTDKALLYSRKRDYFTFDGSETFYFSLAGNPYSWTPNQTFFSAKELAESINAVLNVNDGSCYEDQGYVVLESPISVEIWWGLASLNTKDFSGSSAIGFLPGWSAYADVITWNFDSGMTFGFFRAQEKPDFEAYSQVTKEKINSSFPGLVFLNQTPIRDIPGVGEDTYFETKQSNVYTPLYNYEDIVYRFEDKKFLWVLNQETLNTVNQPVNLLPLGQNQVVPESLDVNDGGLYLAEGGQFVYQQRDTDYTLLQDSSAVLTNAFGPKILTGVAGSVIQGQSILTDTTVSFSDVSQGSLLQIEDLFYPIVTVGTTTIEIDGAFPETKQTSWTIYDRTYKVITNQVYEAWSHLQDEPFLVKLLTKLDIADPVFFSTRQFTIRYGLSEVDGSVYVLAKSNLGTLTEDTSLASVSNNAHFLSGDFKLQIGLNSFTATLVSTFSEEPTEIEYKATGELNFPASVLTEYEGASVWYIETLPALVTSPEYDYESGALRLPSVNTAYAVETLQPNLDVTLSPTLGSFALAAPAKTGQLLEASYYQADRQSQPTGDLVTEFLPVSIQNEIATRLSSAQYQFNLSGNTITDSSQVVVYVDSELQGFGGSIDYTISYDANQKWLIFFLGKQITSTQTVKVSYPVLEAKGGETIYNTSKRPVYRPSFYIPKGSSYLALRGDRSAEFFIGQMLRIGPDTFYVKGSTYYSSGNATQVDIFPSPIVEIGSRSSTEPLLLLRTTKPMVDVVDPFGNLPVSVLDPPPDYFETFESDFTIGRDTIRFFKPLTFTPGHILEIDGDPYTIVQSLISDDGANTTVTVSSPFRSLFNTVTRFRVTTFPVYPPGVTQPLPVGPVYESRPYILVRSGQTQVLGLDYTINASSGEITLAQALNGSDSLWFLFHQTKTLSPSVQNGILVYPRYLARFLYVSASRANEVYASYSYRSSDSFYTAIRPFAEDLEDFLIGPTALENWNQGLALTNAAVLQDKIARRLLAFYASFVEGIEQTIETIEGRAIGDADGRFKFFYGIKDNPPPGYEDTFSGKLNPRNLWAYVYYSVSNGSEIHVQISDDILDPSTVSLVGNTLTGSFLASTLLASLIERQKQFALNSVDDLALTGVVQSTVPSANSPYFTVKGKGVYQDLADRHSLSRFFPLKTKGFLTTYPGIGYDDSTDPITAGFYSAGRYDALGQFQSTNGLEIGQVKNPVLGNIGNITTSQVSKRRARAYIYSFYEDGISPYTVNPCFVVSLQTLDTFPIDVVTGLPDFAQLISQGGDIYDAVSGDPTRSIPGFQIGDQIGFGLATGQTYKGLYQDLLVSGDTQIYKGLFVDDVLQGCIITFRDDPAGSVITDASKILVGTGPLYGISVVDFPIQNGDTLFAIPQTIGNAASPNPGDINSIAFAIDTYRVGVDVRLDADGKLRDITLPTAADGVVYDLRAITGQNPPIPLEALDTDVSFTNGQLTPLQIPALSSRFQNDAGDYNLPYKTFASEKELLHRLYDSLSVIPNAVNSGSYIYPEEVYAQDGQVVDTGGNPFGTEGALTEAAVLMSFSDASPKTHNPGDVGLGDLASYDLLFLETNQPGVPQGILSIGAMRSPQVGPTSYGSFIEPPRFVTQTTASVNGSNLTGSPVRYVLNNALVYTNSSYPVDPQITPPDGVRLIEVDTNGDTVPDTTVLDFSGIAIALNNGLVSGQGNFNSLWSSLMGDGKYNNKITIKLYSRTDSNIVNTPGGNPLPSAGSLLYTIIIEKGTVTAVDYANDTTNTVNLAVAADLQFGVTYTGNIAPIIDNKQIVIAQAGLIDFNAPGNENEWFLPFVLTNSGAPGEKRESIYGWEFSISVDTYNWDGLDIGESQTAYISDDRLTFNEVIDLRLSKQRGTEHPLNNSTNLETSLVVEEITVDGFGSTVNRDVNGTSGPNAIPFTFVSDGDWSQAGPAYAPPERGYLKIPAFEGYNNTAIDVADIRFSASPSSLYGEDGLICQGNGVTESKNNGSVTNAFRYDDRIVNIAVTGGDVARILPGDTLVIKRANDLLHDATTKAGMYLVRHAVKPNSGQLRLESPFATLGHANGFLTSAFPRVVLLDTNTNELTVDDVTGFPASGRVYVIVDPGKLSNAVQSIYKQSLYSATYTSISGNQFLGLATYIWADGTAITGQELTNLAKTSKGRYVSGMTAFPISVRNFGGLPDVSSIVGEHNAPTSVYGVRYLTFGSPSGNSLILSSSGLTIVTGSSPASGKIGVGTTTPIDNTMYNSDVDAIVYPEVPTSVHLNLSGAQWNSLNNPQAHPGNVACLIPSTILTMANGVTPGFAAVGGIYLEPSWPTPIFDLADTTVHVVDVNYSLSAIGMRNYNDYLGQGVAANTNPESVIFEVRRIRRFKESIGSLGSDLSKVYEIRRGRVTGYTETNQQFGILTAVAFQMTWNTDNPTYPVVSNVWNDDRTYQGTNLGPFTDVGVQPGDPIHVLDEFNQVKDTAEIIAVLSGTSVKLAVPGLQNVSVGDRFEIFIRQPLVPHEQSFEQMLSATTETIRTSFADFDLETGGYVPAIDLGETYEDAVNQFKDIEVTNWSDVAIGDILIIDPRPVNGYRPSGDQSVSNRINIYEAGKPNALDDNRGFYKITEILGDTLTVSGLNTLVGSINAQGVVKDIVFPSSSSNLAWCLLPTIHNSGLGQGGREGQMDLRPTGNFVDHSVGPIHYQIVRPNTLVEVNTLDLVLLSRERMLSWVEKLKLFLRENKDGSYHTFQRLGHIDHVSYGVASNVEISNILGIIGYSPYANSADCLSILDRLFWIKDSTLAALRPLNDYQYQSASGGPSYPTENGPYVNYSLTGDTYEDILTVNLEPLREERYRWLDYRVNQGTGTLRRM